MAEQLLFGTADRMIGTLGSLAAKEIRLLWGVKDETRRLTNTVSIIKDVLLDAEKKHAAGDQAVTRWLGSLDDLIYEADDLLDAVSTEALRRQIMTRHKKAKKVRIFFSKSNQLVFRHKMAHKIKDIRERLDDIDKDRQRFNLEVRHEEETRVRGNRETCSTVCAEEVIGREHDKKAVIHRLLDSNVEHNVTILPIVGIGGLGKTTLAQLIFNDDQIQKHFQLKMWVCVSDTFDVKNMVEKILEDAKLKTKEETLDAKNMVEKILEAATKTKPETVAMETLVGELKKEIDGKKYLLVLDDVWNEDHEKWSRLKAVLMGGARGSTILLTTRSKKVAMITETVESHFLRGLDDDQSWSLFKQMAFEKGQEPKENSIIVAIGREILAKCSGVPLAIRTIGSLLLFKKSEEEWLSFKKTELSKISQNENDILPTLKLSYDHLPSHLKLCFAYCCLFPKDYQIERSTLIQLWIAQGFVKSSDQNLEDVGNEYFMDLLWRSFFQQAETDDFGIVYGCKMHDLMHDLAILVAGSMITTLDAKKTNVDEKTRHVSVCSDIDALSIATSLCKASSMRTLLSGRQRFAQEESWGESDCEAIFSSSKFLRVLVPGRRKLDFLPSSIGKLKHLRYLDLSWNDNLKKLPNSITRLQNLQTLKLSFCKNLEELPRDIKKLVNLRHLKIAGCDGLTYMPRGLGQLTNLQTLSKFVVDKDPLSRYSSGLRELNGLNNLRGELCIQNLRHGKDVASECKAANLKEKQHLHGLHLLWSSEGGVHDSDVNDDDEVLLEVLQPHPILKWLSLVGNFGSRLPSCLLSLTNLVYFCLSNCTKCQYLPPLSQLPSLKYLELKYLDALEYISDSNEFSSSSSASVPLFPSLNSICFRNCPNLKGWWRRRDSSVEVNSDTSNSVEITKHPLLPSFPCFSTLWINNCPMLTSMPMFPHLEEVLDLQYASWKPVQQTMMMNMAAPQSPTSTATASFSSTPLSKLKFIQLDSIADLETLPEEGLKNLTSLKSLKIFRCDRLNSLSPGIQHLTALEDLDLENCPELELANDEDGMQWQGLKSLLSLKFINLPKLVSLPLGLQHATTLQSLYISNCENLTALPEGMRSLTTLQSLEIRGCPVLLQRCEREAGEDWPKISHIPKLKLQQPPQQRENSNTHSSSTHSDSEVEEPAKAQKKQRMWSIFKKSKALNL